jgi:Rrf2 family protein
LLSDTAEYALRAVLYIAQQDTTEDLVRAEEVSEALGVPGNYLSKILHVLAREGVLASTRGPRGGFRLKRDADRLTLITVIAPFDPMEPRRVCLLGRPSCNDSNPCPAHERWKGISEQVGRFFRFTTIGDLLRDPAQLALKPASARSRSSRT